MQLPFAPLSSRFRLWSVVILNPVFLPSPRVPRSRFPISASLDAWTLPREEASPPILGGGGGAWLPSLHVASGGSFVCLPPSAGGSDGHICGSWEAEVGPACAALPCVCVCVWRGWGHLKKSNRIIPAEDGPVFIHQHSHQVCLIVLRVDLTINHSNLRNGIQALTWSSVV